MIKLYRQFNDVGLHILAIKEKKLATFINVNDFIYIYYLFISYFIKSSILISNKKKFTSFQQKDQKKKIHHNKVTILFIIKRKSH